MYVLFDMSGNRTIRVQLFTADTVIAEVEKQGSNVELLAVLDALLQEYQYTQADITGIAVVVGAGAFTGTRLAVTVANTFAFVRQIPVAAVSIEDMISITKIAKAIEHTPPGQYISATYSGDPRIHVKKKE